MSAKHVFRPLSTEPPTFGQGVDILAFEKEVQSRLTTKKKVRKVLNRLNMLVERMNTITLGMVTFYVQHRRYGFRQIVRVGERNSGMG